MANYTAKQKKRVRAVQTLTPYPNENETPLKHLSDRVGRLVRSKARETLNESQINNPRIKKRGLYQFLSFTLSLGNQTQE